MAENTKTENTDVAKDISKLPPFLRKSKVVASRLRRKLGKHIYLLRSLIVAGILLVAWLLFSLLFNYLGRTNVGFYWDVGKNFIFTPSTNIQSIDQRTNILVLGKGGKGHEAPDLTDTIILASVDHSKPSFTMISFPRDIWISPLKAKINSVYYWGNRRQPEGGGLILAKSTIEEVSGQPVHYALVIDFSGFKEIIDVLGGIEVDVENSFTDEKYPIAGREEDLCEGDPEYKCRYETIHFEKGIKHMDGETALKFVRSRNAEGDNGTDLARAARQQKIVAAIKDKTLSREVLLSPKKLKKLKDAVLASVETDIPPRAAAILARRFLQSQNDTKTHVLGEELLDRPPISPEYDNLYVFIPKGEELGAEEQDWLKIHRWVECIISENSNCDN